MPDKMPLRDKRIFVVEDDQLLAMMIEEDLHAAGATVIGPVPSRKAALEFLERDEPLDAAILDINLIDGDVYEAADLLLSQRKPFVFASSVTRGEMPERFANVPLFFKPLDMRRYLAKAFEDASGVLPG